MTAERVLTLEEIRASRHALCLRFGFRAGSLDLGFSTTYWYEGVDLAALAARYAPDMVERLAVHVALFELNKLCSLRPDRLELGPWARFFTAELEELWRTVFHHVWAEWRYENDDPGYAGPVIAGPRAPRVTALEPREAAQGQAEVLAFCGGGKDSLVTMRLLERAGIAYDVFSYASSIYGPARAQHALIDALIDRCAPGQRLRQWVFDDFLDSPVLALHPELGVKMLTAAETPSSIFAVLPVVLQHGHGSICLGHERSADTGQVRWPRTGEDVNHQWGKSLAAQVAIERYIRAVLLADVQCFSPLKPIYDLVIFGLLRSDPDDVPYIHSCNVRKPWCLACPKCLYVWLGCAAMLPRELVHRTFGSDDLLARPALVPGFRALLGLDGRQPFECIGTPDEVKIYLAACAARGYRGPAVDLFHEHCGAPAALLPRIEQYLSVDLGHAAMPAVYGQRLGPVLEAAAARTRAYLTAVLRGEAVA